MPISEANVRVAGAAPVSAQTTRGGFRTSTPRTRIGRTQRQVQALRAGQRVRVQTGPVRRIERPLRGSQLDLVGHFLCGARSLPPSSAAGPRPGTGTLSGTAALRAARRSAPSSSCEDSSRANSNSTRARSSRFCDTRAEYRKPAVSWPPAALRQHTANVTRCFRSSTPRL